MLCHDMPTSKAAMAKQIEFSTWHGQLTKFKEPPSSKCIYCRKSNTNKEEVDKHVMCHTSKEEKKLGCEHCEKAFTRYHTQILTCEKPKKI